MMSVDILYATFVSLTLFRNELTLNSLGLENKKRVGRTNVSLTKVYKLPVVG